MASRSAFRRLSQVSMALGGSYAVYFGPMLPGDIVESVHFRLSKTRMSYLLSLDGVAGATYAYEERILTFLMAWQEVKGRSDIAQSSFAIAGTRKSLFESTTTVQGLETMTVPLFEQHDIPLMAPVEGKFLGLHFSAGAGGAGDVAVGATVIGWASCLVIPGPNQDQVLRGVIGRR